MVLRPAGTILTFSDPLSLVPASLPLASRLRATQWFCVAAARVTKRASLPEQAESRRTSPAFVKVWAVSIGWKGPCENALLAAKYFFPSGQCLQFCQSLYIFPPSRLRVRVFPCCRQSVPMG